jgi:hypothetical protein
MYSWDFGARSSRRSKLLFRNENGAQPGARANDHGCHASCAEPHEPRQPRSWLILNVRQKMHRRLWTSLVLAASCAAQATAPNPSPAKAGEKPAADSGRFRASTTSSRGGQLSDGVEDEVYVALKLQASSPPSAVSDRDQAIARFALSPEEAELLQFLAAQNFAALPSLWEKVLSRLRVGDTAKQAQDVFRSEGVKWIPDILPRLPSETATLVGQYRTSSRSFFSITATLDGEGRITKITVSEHFKWLVKKPNQSLEPTRGAVTPRAPEASSK